MLKYSLNLNFEFTVQSVKAWIQNFIYNYILKCTTKRSKLLFDEVAMQTNFSL